MKTRYWFITLLSAGMFSNCREDHPTTSQSTTQAPAQTAEIAPPASAATPENQAFTHPVVWLKPIVPVLNLRSSPDTASPVSGQIRQDSNYFGRVKWTGKISDRKDRIAIRGKIGDFPWLQVTTDDGLSPVSWVYAGGMRPCLIDFGFERPLPDTLLQNPWIELEPIDSMRFIRAKRDSRQEIRPIWTDAHADSIMNDTTPVRILAGGKTRVLHNRISNGEGYTDHKYVGRLGDWQIVSRAFWEWGDLLLIRSTDGLEFHTAGSSSNWPLLSPDKRLMAFPSYQGYDFGNGIEIIDPDRHESLVIAFAGRVTDLFWVSDRELMFKASDTYSSSGNTIPVVWYRIKLSNLLN